MFGVRYNFVRRNRRIAPYLETRGGVGDVDAKGPSGVLYAQGQDLTFNFIMAGGARYNFNPRYSVAAGIEYMHISNFYMSGPKAPNFGINVCGPTLGVNIGLRAEPLKSKIIHSLQAAINNVNARMPSSQETRLAIGGHHLIAAPRHVFVHIQCCYL